MNIITNNQPRDVVTYYDLTDSEKKEFDWGGAEECGYFRYKGSAYCLDDFVRNKLNDWDGVHNLTLFSGLLLRIIDSESVIVGYYYQ
jgi:hypothetical protein